MDDYMDLDQAIVRGLRAEVEKLKAQIAELQSYIRKPGPAEQAALKILDEYTFGPDGINTEPDYSWVNNGHCCRVHTSPFEQMKTMIVCTECGDKNCPKAGLCERKCPQGCKHRWDVVGTTATCMDCFCIQPKYEGGVIGPQWMEGW